jgi:hypothetical protein
MNERSLVPDGEALRRAVRWLCEQRPITPARIDEAALRFDLSPLEVAFLLREFVGDPPGRR